MTVHDGNSFPHSILRVSQPFPTYPKNCVEEKNSLLYLSMSRFVHYPDVLLKSQIPRQNLAKLSFVAKVAPWHPLFVFVLFCFSSY